MRTFSIYIQKICCTISKNYFKIHVQNLKPNQSIDKTNKLCPEFQLPKSSIQIKYNLATEKLLDYCNRNIEYKLGKFCWVYPGIRIRIVIH